MSEQQQPQQPSFEHGPVVNYGALADYEPRIADPTGKVELLQPENTQSPAHPTEAVVLPAAPELTWFVTTFDDVCDRFGFTSKGGSFIVGVPPGYPRRNDCAS